MNIKEGISNKMPTNFDHNPKLATRGQQVRLKSFGHPDGPRSTWSGTEPEAWQRVGNVRGIEIDPFLSDNR